MRPGLGSDLYKKLLTRKISVRQVCEIAVFIPEMPGVTVLPDAVYDHHGVPELVQRNASTIVRIRRTRKKAERLFRGRKEKGG